MEIAKLANALQEARGHRQESSLALHRFDDDGGHGGWVHLRHHGLLQLLDTEGDIFVFGHAWRRAIEVGNGKAHDLRRERAEAALEEPVFAGEAQSEQRAPMIRAFKADHGGSARVFARQLHRVLHSLGAAVGEQCFFRKRAGRDFVQQFRQGHIRLVGGNQRAGMNERFGLLLDGLDHRRGRVTHGQHTDATRQIDERVSIHVENQRAFRAFHNDIRSATQAGRDGRGATCQQLFRLGPGDFSIDSDIRHSMVSACAAHVFFRVQNQQDAVIITNRIVQIIRQQAARFEADVHLHGKRWIADCTSEHAFVVLLGRHSFFQRAIAGNHSGGDLPFELQPPDNFLPGGVKRRGQAASAIFRAHAHVRAVEPRAIRLVRSEPAALDDVGEGVVHVVEIEVEPQRGGCAHHAAAVQRDKLAVLEQFHVLQEMRALEALVVGQRGETEDLQLFKLCRVLRTRLSDDETISEFSMIPAQNILYRGKLRRGLRPEA